MNYLKVLGFQLNVNLDCDGMNEYMIMNHSFEEEMEAIQEIIASKNADVVILPEMCYQECYDSFWQELSKDTFVVAGSIYQDGTNYTVLFSEGEKIFLPKCNASGAEPMIRRIQECSVKTFLNNHLNDHTFVVHDKKIVVLNCMEYYQNAYSIARENPDLFGMICICSNNNQKVFVEESRAIHNHCEHVYTFLVNCVSTYMGKDYAKGESYIYGPIQGHEQEWLRKDHIEMDRHACSILKLGNDAEYFYGEFINSFSRFGRSDEYLNNPRNVEVGIIRKRVLK